MMGLVASLLPYLFGHSDRDLEGVNHGQMLETLIVSHTTQLEVGEQGDSCIHYESVFDRFWKISCAPTDRNGHEVLS